MRFIAVGFSKRLFALTNGAASRAVQCTGAAVANGFFFEINVNSRRPVMPDVELSRLRRCDIDGFFDVALMQRCGAFASFLCAV